MAARKKRPRKAPAACWVSWCEGCGKILAASNSALISIRAKATCKCPPGTACEPATTLYVTDRIAMQNSDALRAKLEHAHAEIKHLRAAHDRLQREHGKTTGDVF